MFGLWRRKFWGAPLDDTMIAVRSGAVVVARPLMVAWDQGLGDAPTPGDVFDVADTDRVSLVTWSGTPVALYNHRTQEQWRYSVADKLPRTWLLAFVTGVTWAVFQHWLLLPGLWIIMGAMWQISRKGPIRRKLDRMTEAALDRIAAPATPGFAAVPMVAQPAVPDAAAFVGPARRSFGKRVAR